MPLDALGTTVLPLDSDERWSVNRNTITEPRTGFMPVDDNLALYLLTLQIKDAWAKRFNDGNNHCIVGWVANTCEPTTTFNLTSMNEQAKRILWRLHNALPKSAQRPTRNPAWTLARYNDSHQHKTMIRLCRRAYKMYINEIWTDHGGRATYLGVALKWQTHLFTPQGNRRKNTYAQLAR